MNRLLATAASIVLAVPLALLAQADEARTQEQARRAAERLQALHAEADRLAGEARTLLGELRALEVKRQIAAEELRQVVQDAAAATAQLRALDADLRRLEAEDQAMLPGLKQRLVETYKLGRGGYARLLLSTSELRRIGQAARTVSMLAQRDRDQIEARRQRLAELLAARTAIEQRQSELALLRASAERAQAAAARAVRERDALLQQIDERRDLTAQLAGELQVAQTTLQQTLRAMATGGSPAAAVLPIKPFQGELDWPVAGSVRRRFASAPAQTPAANGIEIATAESADVHAVHEGTVVYADTFTGFGKLVIVEHDSRNFTLYGHLLEIAVANGDRVAKGDVVGSAGLTPSGAPGLYFETRIDGESVDPLQWLKKR